MKTWLQHKWTLVVSLLLSFIFFIVISRYTPRYYFIQLSTCWMLLFGLSWVIVEHRKIKIQHILFIGIFFRLLLIDLLPWMSQDYFRFIWDGRLLLKGINPYLSTPLQHISKGSFLVNNALELFEGMGSLNAKHYTNYPPMSQFGYWLATIFGNHSILVSVITMRTLLIAADIGTFFAGIKLLKLLKLPAKNIGYYFLNPFVIIELIGNLHFEALMVFFLVVSLYFILKKQWVLGGVLFGLAVNVKLLPLLLTPIFARFFLKQPLQSYHSIQSFFLYEWKSILKYLLFVCLVLGINILLFTPFITPELISNYGSSVSLWFNSFEFNASFYYIARWIGYQITGWNVIAITGKLLPAVAVLGIFLISIFRKNEKVEVLIPSLLFGFTLYLLSSTTVHPWYLAIPLALACFTNYKFLWVWTIVIIFSYNAYSDPNHWEENLWWVGLEYCFVFLSILSNNSFINTHKDTTNQ